MSKRYKELMDSIELTPRAKERITENIMSANIPRQKQNGKFIIYKKYISAAACFIIILTGILLAPIVKDNGFYKNPPAVEYDGAPQSFDSGDELKKAADFEIADIGRYLPFAIEETTYTFYGGVKIAEIYYEGRTNYAAYRKSPGREENSGDYNVYEDIITADISDIKVEIKGNNGIYNLALWEKGGYSYSLNLQNGIEKDDYISILGKII